MAQFRQGDMLTPDNWNAAGLVLITTNGTINGQNALVMGAGIARQARDRFSGLDKVLAGQIQAVSAAVTPFEHRGRRYRVYSPPYGLLISPEWPRKKLGLFQVKTRFYQDASLDVLMASAEALLVWCVEHPGAVVYLNFPGIGNGRLDRDKVLPIVSKLPDTVVVWNKD